MFAMPEDRKIFRAIIREKWQGNNFKSPGELMLDVGAHFLGTLFAPNTLEQSAGEELVINLRQLDCFTFVENTVALTGLIKAGKTSFPDFAAALKTSRYRKGLLDGYASRLHYFSDWLHDNQEKRLIKDITREIGGEPFYKEIRFMTANADRYPALKCPDAHGRMLAVEKACSGRALYHIPKAKLKACMDKIKHGDILAVTTGMEGLDVIHTGIGIYLKNNLHLLHASQRAGKVIISEETLYRYLAKSRTCLGIMVGRVL